MMSLKERFLRVKTLHEGELKKVNDLDLEIALLESDLDVKQQAQAVLDLLAEKEVEEGVSRLAKIKAHAMEFEAERQKG